MTVVAIDADSLARTRPLPWRLPVIRVIDQMPDGVIGVEAAGKLSAKDYTTVLAPVLAAATEGGGKIRIVLVFGDEFEGMEPGAVLQDVRTGIHDWTAWERIALVTDHGWMRDGLRMFAWAVPGEVKAFPMDERDTAVAWAAETV
jgi:hypothetical protein